MQTHIFVTKRSVSQVNPLQSSQLLLGVHEVSRSLRSRAARKSNNAATARWNRRHASGYETREHHPCYFRGGIVHSFPSLSLFSAVVVGSTCLTNNTPCIKVPSSIECHIKYGVHKVREPKFCKSDTLMCSYVTYTNSIVWCVAFEYVIHLLSNIRHVYTTIIPYI